MPGRFVCVLEMFSKQFPAGDRTVVLLFEKYNVLYDAVGDIYFTHTLHQQQWR